MVVVVVVVICARTKFDNSILTTVCTLGYRDDSTHHWLTNWLTGVLLNGTTLYAGILRALLTCSPTGWLVRWPAALSSAVHCVCLLATAFGLFVAVCVVSWQTWQLESHHNCRVVIKTACAAHTTSINHPSHSMAKGKIKRKNKIKWGQRKNKNTNTSNVLTAALSRFIKVKCVCVFGYIYTVYI